MQITATILQERHTADAAVASSWMGLHVESYDSACENDRPLKMLDERSAGGREACASDDRRTRDE